MQSSAACGFYVEGKLYTNITTVVGTVVDFPPNQIGYWPLNEEHGGRNLVIGNGDFQLSGVMFGTDDRKTARFTGEDNSYAEIIDNPGTLFCLSSLFFFPSVINCTHCLWCSLTHTFLFYFCHFK